MLSVKKPVRIFKASRSQCVTECKAYALNKREKKKEKKRVEEISQDERKKIREESTVHNQ